MSVLTGIDILGIQNYIFASNRLRDVYAASWMVEHVTDAELIRKVPGASPPKEVLQAAGGNAILEFDDLASAKDWTAAYTRWLWNTAPGLSAVVAHRPRDGKSLAWGVMALRMDMARSKLERIPDAPQLGLSVTAPCAVTGLPAVHEEFGALLSPQIRELRKQRETAQNRWDGFLPKNIPNAPDQTFAFPEELDHMGRSHGTISRIGIVHVDGNRIGGAIRKWLERNMNPKTDDETVRREMEEWSNGLRNLAEGVLQTLCGRVSQAIHAENGGCGLRGTPFEKGFPLVADKDRGGEGKAYFLPMRPILLGGDDLTFVCDGRIALDLAAAAVREFEKAPIPHLGEGGGEKTVTACAGVALVKAHAPFHRGYKLSEDLCKSAKQGRLKAMDDAMDD
ncbi:MAG: Cas10/Cmr2 second palm domain-containing protein, partial [Desulfococcaceae bacterium]